MASSQHGTSYTGQHPQPPVFETADELYDALEDLIEKGMVLPFLDDHQQLRFRLLPQTDGTFNLEDGCGTLISEIAF